MRATLCAAACLALFAPCFAKTPEHSHPLTIIYRFDGAPSDIAFRELRSEVGLLLRSSSIRPEWRDRRSIGTREAFENLVVVSFHGRCHAGGEDPAPESRSVLGHANVTDGQVQPFIDIECSRVEASLHSTASGGRRPDANAALGRALARVLAHELYHVLAQTTAHTSIGIEKASLSSAELAASRLTFASAEAKRMELPEAESPRHVPESEMSEAPAFKR